MNEFYPRSKAEWRRWLEGHHASEDSVWLIYYNKASGQPSLKWSDAVDEALCFGWIDSVHRKRDKDSSIQFFSKRKAKSTWSRVNKNKIEVLIAEGKMMPAGYASIELAKQNGSWEILDAVEDLTIPEELQKAFNKNKKAEEFFHAQSKSIRKATLQWLIMAKRPETRAKRIEEIIERGNQSLRPRHLT